MKKFYNLGACIDLTFHTTFQLDLSSGSDNELENKCSRRPERGILGGMTSSCK